MNYDKHLYGMAASDPLEYAARRNAGRKLGFLMHATVYVIVNLGLMLLAWSQGRHWAVYPALFWGIGLACHAASVWLRSPNNSLWHNMVQRERSALRRAQSTDRQDPP